jgi:hypothetical protein
MGFIDYAGGEKGGLQVHSSLLNVVLHDWVLHDSVPQVSTIGFPESSHSGNPVFSDLPHSRHRALYFEVIRWHDGHTVRDPKSPSFGRTVRTSVLRIPVIESTSARKRLRNLSNTGAILDPRSFSAWFEIGGWSKLLVAKYSHGGRVVTGQNWPHVFALV